MTIKLNVDKNYTAIIQAGSDPSNVFILAPGRDIKERFLRTLKEIHRCQKVELESVQKVPEEGHYQTTVTLHWNERKSQVIELIAAPTWIY